MNKRKLVFVILLMLILFLFAGYKLYLQRQTSNTFTGTVEVTTVDIMAKTNGYLQTLTIKEGDRVTDGQLIAVLDRSDFAAQLARDAAALAKAEAQLTDLEKGARAEELQEAAANVAAASSLSGKAAADFARCLTLYHEGAISVQQLDEARSANEVAANNLLAARQKQSLLLAGNRSDAIEAQKQEVYRSEAALKLTKISAEDMNIFTPLSGLVLTKNVERGEYVNAGSPIATVADTQDCWVKVYVPSADLGRLSIGQQASVNIDAYPDKHFLGVVKEISTAAEFTPRQSITKNERANMVFAVKIAVENSGEHLKPGMPADVIFND